MSNQQNVQQSSNKAVMEVFDTMKDRLQHIEYHGGKQRILYALHDTSPQLYEDVLETFPSFLTQFERENPTQESVLEILREIYFNLLEENSRFKDILAIKAVKDKAIALSKNYLAFANYHQLNTYGRSPSHRVQHFLTQSSEVRHELILQLFNRLDDFSEDQHGTSVETYNYVQPTIINAIGHLIHVEAALPIAIQNRLVLWSETQYTCYEIFLLNILNNHIESNKALSDNIVSMLRRSYIDNDRSAELKSIIKTLEGPLLNSGEAWTDALLDFLKKNPKWQAVIEHAKTATMSKPSKEWLNTATTLLTTVDKPEKILDFLLLVGKPRSTILKNPSFARGDVNQLFDKYNVDTARGLAWIASTFNNDEAARVLAKLTETSLKKVQGVGPRNVKLANAGIISLSKIEGEASVVQLAYLKSRVTFKTTLKQIEKALDIAAERAGLSKEDLEEMSVPNFGLDEDGKRIEHFDEARAELSIQNGVAKLEYYNDKGKQVKSPPASVKKDFADEVKELKTTIKDVTKMLSATSSRIEKHHLSQKTWDYGIWKERYIQSPIVAAISKRLIWRFTSGKSHINAIWHDDSFKDSKGSAVTISKDSQVSLWHPLDSETEEVLAWRAWLDEKQIRQPWKQAHREIYLLTDAERNTGTYSNRYAAHILKQHQFNQLCAIRGWRSTLRLCVDDSYNPAMLELPQWNLRAEYWIEGIGEYGEDTTDTGTYLRLVTDQVRFYPLNAAKNYAHANGGGYVTRFTEGDIIEPLPIEEIPALVFSEVMRDVDLFVGVTSVGNDPTWQDGGPEGRFQEYWHSYSFGTWSESAESRKGVLEQLIPRLKIRDCAEIDGKFLKIKGDIRTYKIHLGSSNILMEPNDQYLCIVPDSRMNKKVGDVFLPFDGDRTLSLILSKAFLLAEDTKIKDSVIVNQIKRKQ